jgi:hypothetical protein
MVVTFVPFAEPLLPSTGTLILNFSQTSPNRVVNTTRTPKLLAKILPVHTLGEFKSRTIDITTRITALSVGTSRDIAQDSLLANAVAVLVCVRAIDGSDRCGITGFLGSIVSRHPRLTCTGSLERKRTTHAGIIAA